MSYKFFQNKDCEFFPCHKIKNTSAFSCQFCFCPLYNYDDCGGNFKILENGVKDCSACLKPHLDYDYVIQKLQNK